jgi:hypothetical protein
MIHFHHPLPASEWLRWPHWPHLAAAAVLLAVAAAVAWKKARPRRVARPRRDVRIGPVRRAGLWQLQFEFRLLSWFLGRERRKLRKERAA